MIIKRQHLYGDGCIGTRTTPSGEKKTYFNIIGNRPLIQKIQEILIHNCNLNQTKLYHKKGTRENIVSLAYNGCNQIIKIRDYLYKDATIYMQRKYDKMQLLGTNEWRTYSNMGTYCHSCSKKITKRYSYIAENDIYCYSCYKKYFRESKSVKQNTIIIHDQYAELIITSKSGLITAVKIDTDKVEDVNKYVWHIENGYVVHRQRYPKQCLYLQRYITNANQEDIIRFKDNDRYNCTIQNLTKEEKNIA